MPGGGEERVAGGVGRHVGVGVALETLRLVGPGQAGQVEGHARDEAVDVGADADAGKAHAPIMPDGGKRHHYVTSRATSGIGNDGQWRREVAGRRPES